MASRLLPFRRALAARSIRPHAPRQAIVYSNIRSIASGSPNADSQKEAQLHREKMDTQPNEYAKGGTDADTAKNDAAFDPNSSNDPEDAKKGGAGLEQSPASPELSSGTSEVEGGADKKMSQGGGGRQGGGDSTGNKSSGSSV